MKKAVFALLLVFMAVKPAFAVEVAPRVTDREIVESLANIRGDIKRLEEGIKSLDKRFDQIDKRFEQVDKRFEQVDKRFDEQLRFMETLAAIFTALTISVIGFAYWDRRTIISKAKEETIAEIEKEGKLGTLVHVLRELSKKDLEVEKVLKQFNLL
jgi:nitrogen fixation/metabolism regulation signal transduction histidine kinase